MEFPVSYEGPPGIVHGGFLAVFFDCVLQQLNCDARARGQDRRALAPVPAPDAVADAARRTRAERVVDGSRITVHAELLLDDKVLCEAHMLAAKGERGALPDRVGAPAMSASDAPSAACCARRSRERPDPTTSSATTIA